MSRLARGTALAAIVCLWLAAARPADAASGRAEWESLATRLAAPWPRIQRANGSLPDAIRPRSRYRYGNGIAGLGLIQTGLRAHRRGLIRAGLRAVTAETRRLFDSASVQEFRIWAVASAYVLARKRLRRWRSARLALRRWAPWLRRQRAFWLRRPGFQNKLLVEAVAVLELVRTRLRSAAPGSILGRSRGALIARVRRLVNRRIPRHVRRPGRMLSDPRGQPPAYHVLSFAMYARAVDLLGARASSRARGALARLATTTAGITAPTGDVAYWGRSQLASWTLSAGAYGLAAAARRRPAKRSTYLAAADRLLRRLDEYGVGPRGEWIVPAMRQSLPAGRRAVDRYAHAPEYGGLALVYLNWALPLLPGRSFAGRIPADTDMHAVVGRARGRFAVVRQGPLWYAVRQRGTGGFRYDFGPVAAKRLEGGRWQDLLPAKPQGHGAAGPRLETAGRTALPVARSLRVASGRVSLRGGFRLRGRWVRKGVRFEVAPTACGISLSFSSPPGDAYRFTHQFPGDPEWVPGERQATIGARTVSFSEPPFYVAFGASRPSVSDAVLTRSDFRIEVGEAGVGQVAVC